LQSQHRQSRQWLHADRSNDAGRTHGGDEHAVRRERGGREPVGVHSAAKQRRGWGSDCAGRSGHGAGRPREHRHGVHWDRDAGARHQPGRRDTVRDGDRRGGALAGTTTVAAASGVATFANLSINRVGTGYTLTAAVTGLTTGTSAAFNITAGTATALVFTVEPSNTAAGVAITPAVQATAQDA